MLSNRLFAFETLQLILNNTASHILLNHQGVLFKIM